MRHVRRYLVLTMSKSERDERVQGLAEQLTSVLQKKAPNWKERSKGLRQQIKSVQKMSGK